MKDKHNDVNKDTDFQMPERRSRELKKIGILLTVGFAYLIWCRATGIRIPCLFNLVTGLYCPGCGITRAAMAISRFDFVRAYNYNKLSLTVVPALLAILIIREYRYIKTGEWRPAKRKIEILENILIGIMFFAAIAYGIMRNMPALRILFGDIFL